MGFSSVNSDKVKLCADRIVIFCDGNKDISLFTAKEMKSALECAGYTVTVSEMKYLHRDTGYHRVFLTVRDSAESNSLLHGINAGELPSSAPQGYSIRKADRYGFIEWYIIGFDDAGMMYGGIDFAETVLQKGLEKTGNRDEKPYISYRGIKFNIPLDARTPSYSDSGDSAQSNIVNMWDMDFWSEFLDEMARRRFNVLSLWNLHPFPSMVKVPAYPKAALNDVMKTTIPLDNELEGRGMSTPESLQNLQTIKTMPIEEKIEFWRDVMQYAKNRGIDIYIFTWNTFIYGTENSGYDFSVSVTDLNTQGYFRKSVEALIKTYPLLKGIGITSGENMSRNAETDETWLYNTYGQGINDALDADPARTFCLIHRIQYANIRKAFDSFSGLNPRCSMETSFKYAQAHMYSSTRPNYIHTNAYLDDIGSHKTWLTVRDDDYYMFRGGCDLEFTREFIKNMPYEKLQGFYIGPDGYTWGREYISREPHKREQLVIKKRWFCFMQWGKIAYAPDSPEEEFVTALKTAFPEVNAHNLLEAWSRSSRIIPLVNRLHNKGCQLDFQWYPEACTGKAGFHDLSRFIETEPQDEEEIMSIRDYTDAVINECGLNGTTPEDIARQLWDDSRAALKLTDAMQPGGNVELCQTIADINALAMLGKYYSKKILGATYKCIADRAADSGIRRQYQGMARESLEQASVYWHSYAEIVDRLYKPQALTRLIPQTPGLSRYIDVAKLQKYVDNDVHLV